MIQLANSRIELLNPIFRLLHYFDSPYFFFLLIPIIWLGFSYLWGLRIFYWFTLNNLIMAGAKNIFAWPRPSTDMPEIALFHPETHGFPSGAAQASMLLGGLLIYYWGTRTAWIIGVSYILLMSFSRLYLAVHYPTDILGGWVVGLLLLALFIYTRAPLERFLIKKGLKFCLILSLAIPLALLLIFPQINYIMGSLLGVGLGTYFSLKHHLFLPKPHTLMEALGRSFVGIVLLFLLVLVFFNYQLFYTSFFVALSMSLGASPVCKWLIQKKL